MITIYIGDSHEEDVGINENHTHQNDNISTSGNINERWESETSRSRIYNGLKQLSLVIDQQYDDEQISQSDFWQQFLPEIAEKGTCETSLL